jgi:hypothetical protein
MKINQPPKVYANDQIGRGPTRRIIGNAAAGTFLNGIVGGIGYGFSFTCPIVAPVLVPATNTVMSLIALTLTAGTALEIIPPPYENGASDVLKWARTQNIIGENGVEFAPTFEELERLGLRNAFAWMTSSQAQRIARGLQNALDEKKRMPEESVRNFTDLLERILSTRYGR